MKHKQYFKFEYIIILLCILCIYLILSKCTSNEMQSEEADTVMLYELSIEDEALQELADIPQVYIETFEVAISLGEYSSVKLIVISSNEKDSIIDKNVLIKIRGQSTASAPKKPYTFKYEQKESLLGMSSGKIWILLANAFDKTLMRNKLVLDFSRNLNFEYVPESRYVDLWLDGEYQGNYLLTQAVTDGDNRVPIQKNQNEFMIEIERDRNENGITYIKTELYKIRFKIEQPETQTTEQLDYLERFMAEMEDAISSKSHEIYEKYIDIDSFIDYNILLNYFKDVDAEYSSTNFYVKDGKLYAGPPWDFDLALGNVNPRHNNPLYFQYNNIRNYGTKSGKSHEGQWADCIWFEYLLQDAYYLDKLKNRYHDLQPFIQNLYIDNETEQNRIDLLLNESEQSFIRNYSNISMWTMKDKFSDMERYAESSYMENVEYLRTWLRLRNEWLINEYFLK